MGVNHDQFCHFSRLRPDSSSVTLQMVVILAQIVSLVASGLHISLEPRGQCSQVVCVVVLWRCRGDWMGVNHDQFSHFSPLRPHFPAAIFQMVVILAQIVILWTCGLQNLD